MRVGLYYFMRIGIMYHDLLYHSFSSSSGWIFQDSECRIERIVNAAQRARDSAHLLRHINPFFFVLSLLLKSKIQRMVLLPILLPIPQDSERPNPQTRPTATSSPPEAPSLFPYHSLRFSSLSPAPYPYMASRAAGTLSSPSAHHVFG
jgi:hypothetical protein